MSEPGSPDDPRPLGLAAGLRRWFFRPPRRHGEILEDRGVSFLELFYDLVFVVLVAQIAHTLAEHVGWRGAADFAVLFGLIWIAWINGALYHELHGREDGRGRSLIFLQMGVLSVVAVYAGGAGGENGQAFAIAYTALLLLLTWQWYVVRRHDPDEFRPATTPYLLGMAVSVLVVAVTVFLPERARLIAWGLLVLAWVGMGLWLFRTDRSGLLVRSITDSMVERYDLFTIIVLGEVVVGVVDGLSEVDLDFRTLFTGVLGLSIGFGFWWTYFDFAGRRLPRRSPRSFCLWLFSHLPTTMAVAASGAGMVSLVEHASDGRTPAGSSWLISASVAAMLLALMGTMRSLADFDRLPALYRPVYLAMFPTALACLLVGALRPAPWLLALLLVLILFAVWLFAFSRQLRVQGVAKATGTG